MRANGPSETLDAQAQCAVWAIGKLKHIESKFKIVEGVLTDGTALRFYGTRRVCYVRRAAGSNFICLLKEKRDAKNQGRPWGLSELLKNEELKDGDVVEQAKYHNLLLRKQQQVLGHLQDRQFALLFNTREDNETVKRCCMNAVDPGKRNPIAGVFASPVRGGERTCSPFRVTSSFMRTKCTAKAERAARKATAAHREHNAKCHMAECAERSCVNLTPAVLLPTHGVPARAVEKTEERYHKQREEQKLAYRFLAEVRWRAARESPGLHPLVLWGGAKGAQKGRGAPNQSSAFFKNLLADHCLVVTVDEAYTSARCPKCLGWTGYVGRSYRRKECRSGCTVPLFFTPSPTMIQLTFSFVRRWSTTRRLAPESCHASALTATWGRPSTSSRRSSSWWRTGTEPPRSSTRTPRCLTVATTTATACHWFSSQCSGRHSGRTAAHCQNDQRGRTINCCGNCPPVLLLASRLVALR